MNATLGLVTDTIAFSNVDGPGNRFVVFLQGCNFDCIACHNPYTINLCNHCGDCVAACPSDALGFSLTGGITVGPRRLQGQRRMHRRMPVGLDSEGLRRPVDDHPRRDPTRRAVPVGDHRVGRRGHAAGRLPARAVRRSSSRSRAQPA